jgi:hypothetical protein
MNAAHTDGLAARGMEEPPVSQALEELMHVVHSLPLAKKAAFLQAMKTCPQVVERESHPLAFCRYDDYNYWKAADRLVHHWTERVSLFGQDRAFLPMTQTGNGALTGDDVMSLRTGSYSILPPTSAGRSVFFIDRSRALANASPQARLRAAFYVLTLLAQEKDAQTRGILAFNLLVSPRTTGLDHDFSHAFYRLMGLFPLKMEVHLLNFLPKCGGKHAVVKQVMTAGFAFCSMYIGAFQVVTERAGAAMLAHLMALGLTAAGVPVSVGGKWTYASFSRWCRDRSSRDVAVEQLHRRTHASAAGTAAEETPDTTTQVVVDEEGKRQRIRTVNVIHSRQKRERRKTEERDLKEECTQLQKQSRHLKATHAKLESLLASAKLVEEAVQEGVMPESSLVPTAVPLPSAPPPDPTTTLQTALQGLTQQPPEIQSLALLVLLSQQQQPQEQQQPVAPLQSLWKPPPQNQLQTLAQAQQSFADMIKPPQATPSPLSQAQSFAEILKPIPQLVQPFAQAQEQSFDAPQKSARPKEGEKQPESPPLNQNALLQVLLAALDQVQKTQALEMNLGLLVQGLLPSLNHHMTQSKAPLGTTCQQACLSSNMPSNAAPDSLATLVTLLLLQAQQHCGS